MRRYWQQLTKGFVMYKLRITTILLLVIISTSPLSASNQALQPGAVFLEKETNNTLDVVKTFLYPRAADGRTKIWVFFTDKNIFNQNQFEQLAATISFTEATRIRRIKMGLEEIVFADLPVHRGYIDDIISLGGELRRVSRWLNAASFEIPLDALDDINDLWFVAKIRPVAAYYRENEIPGDPVDTFLKGEHPEYALDYGISFGQLDQISVPPVHDKGFNGEGVIVAMFDTGYRKDHQTFAEAFSSGRVLAEWDFIFNDGNTQNEPEDTPSQHNHGTYTWSALGGTTAGELYGPAYGASFILAKTEDIRSETPVEEDNWMAAVEWADSIGAQVISSSLSYSDWYSYSDFDGETAVTSIAANLATSMGIVVCNSMGNSGPSAGTLGAPADAFEILSCGAVNSSGNLASFSSRGPTADGRIKPEVCAQGVSTYCASPGSITGYTYVGGTSLSTPLIGGAVAVLLSARPSMTPQAVRLALMHTASQAGNPDNNYGWGIMNLVQALEWGAKFGADVTMGSAPLTVSFVDSSYVPGTDWTWSFGDGDSSDVQNPVHVYDSPGVYDVSMTITSDGRPLTDEKPNFIIALADTITYTGDTVYAGSQAVVDISVVNTQELYSLTVPFDYSTGMSLTFDSFSVAGTRVDGYNTLLVGGSAAERKIAVLIQKSGTTLLPGSGTVLRLYFTTDQYAFGNWKTTIDTVTVDNRGLKLAAEQFDYVPIVHGSEVVIRDVIRGDANDDDTIDVGDPVYLVNYIFREGPGPLSIEAGDANFDFIVDIGDAVFLINYIFRGGPPPNDM
jgi:PKD repeat protein